MNIVVKSSFWRDSDIPTLFGDEDTMFVEDEDISTLLVKLNVYKSTSQARRAGRKGPIPSGYTEYKASKKVTLYIWNPTEE